MLCYDDCDWSNRFHVLCFALFSPYLRRMSGTRVHTHATNDGYTDTVWSMENTSFSKSSSSYCNHTDVTDADPHCDFLIGSLHLSVIITPSIHPPTFFIIRSWFHSRIPVLKRKGLFQGFAFLFQSVLPTCLQATEKRHRVQGPVIECHSIRYLARRPLAN